jgi:hypothetical protein
VIPLLWNIPKGLCVLLFLLRNMGKCKIIDGGRIVHISTEHGLTW